MSENGNAESWVILDGSDAQYGTERFPNSSEAWERIDALGAAGAYMRAERVQPTTALPPVGFERGELSERGIREAFESGPTATVRSAIIAGQPWSVHTVRVIKTEGDTLYCTTDGVWYSMVTNGRYSEWSLDVEAAPEVETHCPDCTYPYASEFALADVCECTSDKMLGLAAHLEMLESLAARTTFKYPARSAGTARAGRYGNAPVPVPARTARKGMN
jgi:hypothetical protein